MPLPCLACKKTGFKNEKARSNHVARCQALQDGLSKREHEPDQDDGGQGGKRLRGMEDDADNRMDIDEDVMPEDQAMEVDVPDVPLPPRSPSPPPVVSARSGRAIRFPQQFQDFLPSVARNPLAHIPDRPPPIPRQPRIVHNTPSPSPPPPPTLYTTEPDDFGVYRVYTRLPRSVPDTTPSLDAVPVSQEPEEPTGPTDDNTGGEDPEAVDPHYAPFSSATAAALFAWQFSGSNLKSDAEAERAAHLLASSPLDREALANYSVRREKALVEKFFDGLDEDADALRAAHGWHKASISIPLPAERVKQTEEDAPRFEVNGVYYRKLTDIITEAFSDPRASPFHFTASTERWHHPDGRDIELFSEAYYSQEMRDAQDEIDALPIDPDEEDLERVVVPLQLASDATHLANFGPASLWPVYVQFGNQSKYVRAQPSSNTCHHVAYMPSIPDSVQDRYTECFGKKASKETLAHLKRELAHGIWDKLTDDEFVRAYAHGIVVKCSDGVRRRLFPRFFTYAADYPEKMLLATLRFYGQCPCPRCLIEKKNIHKLGTKTDTLARDKNARVDSERLQDKKKVSRKLIFESGAPVASERVKRILPGSVVPTENAFSKFLKFGFNFFAMFVPDLLHEIEIGVWKALLIHLIRLLYAAGHGAIEKLNARYRAMPTFGRDTIRRFTTDTSAMKKLAARDFEDLLQCALAVFPGLLPDPAHNKLILKLLFILAWLHGLLKLRKHTTDTVERTKEVTVDFGSTLRKVNNHVFTKYDTHELPREEAARGRREAALAQKKAMESAAGAGAPADTALDAAPDAEEEEREGLDSHASNLDVHGNDNDTDDIRDPGEDDSQQNSDEDTDPASEAGGNERGEEEVDKGGAEGGEEGGDENGGEGGDDEAEEGGREGGEEGGDEGPSRQKGKRMKKFSLNTYKLHAVPDYPPAIMRVGTTDSYSTQTSELQHKVAKAWFSRTNKNKDTFVPDIARHEARARLVRNTLDSLQEHDEAPELNKKKLLAKKRPATAEVAPLPVMDPSAHYQMADSERRPVNLALYLRDNLGDPALKDFLPRLKTHILARRLGLKYDGDEQEFTDEDLESITLVGNNIYEHSTVRVNYTTYDILRAQDTINPANHSDVMVLSREDETDPEHPPHPFWYARVLKVFHVNVCHHGPASKSNKAERMDVLFVRWFGLDSSVKGGFPNYKLHSVGFIPEEDPSAFGFLDPMQVIRAVHIMPDFDRGKTADLLAPSIARRQEDQDQDYIAYLINMFADRDLLMRFMGGGVGHRTTRFCDDALRAAARSHSDADSSSDEDEGMHEDEEQPPHSADEEDQDALDEFWDSDIEDVADVPIIDYGDDLGD
ncbi:hypothetical protein FA95DRAFT_1607083 [Auriscalpium vulgare]|uniref:Uncharacterized protein n=1 Tax=Auriscalpium vulgare TaxID=40419 RepID=A0ACB8RR00_9AGAM|nr:hypothetical protein FA95DRAFT_1607083 [Auriscalpium vulgare]